MPPAASTTFITSPTADLLASFANDRLVVELVFPNAAGAAPLRGLVLWPAADEGGELSDAWRFIVWGTSSKTPASGITWGLPLLDPKEFSIRFLEQREYTQADTWARKPPLFYKMGPITGRESPFDSAELIALSLRFKRPLRFTYTSDRGTSERHVHPRGLRYSLMTADAVADAAVRSFKLPQVSMLRLEGKPITWHDDGAGYVEEG